MTGQFEKLEINKELTAAEKLAIENLKDIDVKTLKAALNTESIKGTDKTFLEMATAYINHVIYTPGGVNGATGETEPGTFSFSAGADDRLKNFVSIDDNNDFAYLLYEISTVLKVDITTGLTSLKLGVETNTQLTALKKEIEKPAVVEVPTGATLEKVGKYTVSTADFTLGVALMDKTTSQITRDISYKNTKLTPTLEFNAD